MKVKELKEFLSDKSDDMEIFVWQMDYDKYDLVESARVGIPETYPEHHPDTPNAILLD